MTRVLILGANGQLARNTTRVLLERTDADLTLYLRRAGRLSKPDPQRTTVDEGDVLDAAALREAMKGQDVVYANLAGDLAPQARAIIDAMQATGLCRLIFISSMGIYSEVPGETYRSVSADRAVRPQLHDPASGLVHTRSGRSHPDHAERRAVPRP